MAAEPGSTKMTPPAAETEKAADKGSVYVETVGGLGNQLFQIAAGLCYAWREGRRCVFRRDWSSPSVLAPRTAHWHTLFTELDQVDAFPAESALTLHADGEMGFRAIPSCPAEKDVFLRGYFQHLQHFERELDRLIPLLFPRRLRAYARTLLLSACAKGTTTNAQWAFMHVRRGDYKHLRHTHPVLPLSYYEHAVQRFDPAVRFLLFCEQEDLTDLRREVFLSPVLAARVGAFVDTRIPDYLQLLMMSMCAAGGVLANSTFCCWAAYIHANAEKAVFVAPARWFVDASRSNLMAGICKPSWHRIDHARLPPIANAMTSLPTDLKIAIYDARIQATGLVKLFPGADYFVTAHAGRYDLDKHPAQFQSQYGFSYREDIDAITPQNYHILCIVYAVLDFPQKERADVQHHYQCIDGVVKRRGFKKLLFFTNDDLPDDPSIAHKDWPVDHWFKRNYARSVKYADNVHPFPFIIFGYVCPLWHILHTDDQTQKDPKKLTWGGAIYPAPKHRKCLGRDVLHAALKDLFQTISLPYSGYLEELGRSAFALDMNGVGDPNKRLFEVLGANALLIQQRNELVWPFESDDAWHQMTIYGTADECRQKVALLQRFPLQYDYCLKKQKELRHKYFSKDWLQNYIARILKLHPTPKTAPDEPKPHQTPATSDSKAVAETAAAAAAAAVEKMEGVPGREGQTVGLAGLIRGGSPAIFAKFGDGELACASGSGGANCDGDPYTTELALGLRRAFPALAAAPHASFGAWIHNPEACKFWESLLRGQKMSARWVDYHVMIIDREGLKSPALLQLYRSIRECGRPKFLVANRLLAKARKFLGVKRHIVVDLRAWFSPAKIAAIVDEIAADCGEKPPLVVTACGMGAKVLIAALYAKWPTGVFLDAGSAIDYLCTRQDSRGWSRPPYSITLAELEEYFRELIPDEWNDPAWEPLYQEAKKQLGIHLRPS